MDVKCPGCAGSLYQMHPIAPDGSQSTVGTPPRVEDDGFDKFIRCPHCAARVVVVRYDTAASIGFRLSHVKAIPSLKRCANGRPPGPIWRYAVHFRQPGPGVLPSSPA